MENRQGLAVDVLVTEASGTAEREAGVAMVKKLRKRHPTRRLTLGADKNYDTQDFVNDMRGLKVTPHVAQNITERRGSRIDGRTAGQPGYTVSQRVRKLRYRGVRRNQLWAEMATAAFNLVRIGNLVLEVA